MSRLAHAVFGARGFEAEKRDMNRAIHIEAGQRRANMVRVYLNVWGNFDCYAAGRKVDVFGHDHEYDATQWLSDRLLDGAVLSPQSCILMAQVLAHRERLARPADKLEACAADVEALFRTYHHVDWWIDRMFGMEFICDQTLDTMHEAFARAGDRDFLRCGLMPSHL